MTRHDRDCGDLYGAPPLVKGLPVMLTDHYDRNPEKNLLKGRRGYIDSWVLDDRDSDTQYDGNNRFLKYPPKLVLVQFYDVVMENGQSVERLCEWFIDGMPKNWVYPGYNQSLGQVLVFGSKTRPSTVAH